MAKDAVVRAVFTPGAVVRRGDNRVMPVLLSVHPTNGNVSFTDETGFGPIGHMVAATRGTCWAVGEWDSEDVVALRALAALEAR